MPEWNAFLGQSQKNEQKRHSFYYKRTPFLYIALACCQKIRPLALCIGGVASSAKVTEGAFYYIINKCPPSGPDGAEFCREPGRLRQHQGSGNEVLPVFGDAGPADIGNLLEPRWPCLSHQRISAGHYSPTASSELPLYHCGKPIWAGQEDRDAHCQE